MKRKKDSAESKIAALALGTECTERISRYERLMNLLAIAEAYLPKVEFADTVQKARSYHSRFSMFQYDIRHDLGIDPACWRQIFSDFDAFAVSRLDWIAKEFLEPMESRLKILERRGGELYAAIKGRAACPAILR